jgi:hypothetical protein
MREEVSEPMWLGKTDIDTQEEKSNTPIPDTQFCFVAAAI